MLELNNVTLMAVTSVRVHEAVNALKYSCKDIKYNGIKLITHEPIEESGIEVIRTEKLDYEGYSKFIVFELHKHFNTDFVLLIQDDGYVINPSAWRQEFFNYDYIGAPWPLPTDDFSYRDKEGNIRRVGNGGFTLRSKRLSQLADDLKLDWEPFHGFYNEDGFFCVNNVHIYESHGMQIAPLNVAKYFSHEKHFAELKGIVPFGFHGKSSKYNILNKPTAYSKIKRMVLSLLQVNACLQ